MVLAIIQARMSSTRLPGKVMRPILGEPMLSRQLERVRRSAELSRIVVATSSEPEDEVIAAFCRSADIGCHRGSLGDVLARYLGALHQFGPFETFVRLTADCPLIDPLLIDRAIVSHRQAGSDYTFVQENWSFPKGLDVEVCQSRTLEAIALEAEGFDREHVTSFIYARPERFKINAINQEPPQRYRWTVDTSQDFDFVTKVYQDLYPKDPKFTTADILAWQSRNPDRVLPNVLNEVGR